MVIDMLQKYQHTEEQHYVTSFVQVDVYISLCLALTIMYTVDNA